VQKGYSLNIVNQYSTPTEPLQSIIQKDYVPQTPPVVVAPIIGKNMVGAEPSLFGNPLKGQPVFNTPESKTIGLAVVTSIISAPLSIPSITAASAASVGKQAIIGAGLNLGLSEVAK
jgi:hypothetical protein